jgi:hypothetical protein
MRRLLCWLYGHEIMATGPRQRICLRCRQQETLRRFGAILAWEQVTPAARGSRS